MVMIHPMNLFWCAAHSVERQSIRKIDLQNCTCSFHCDSNANHSIWRATRYIDVQLHSVFKRQTNSSKLNSIHGVNSLEKSQKTKQNKSVINRNQTATICLRANRNSQHSAHTHGLHTLTFHCVHQVKVCVKGTMANVQNENMFSNVIRAYGRFHCIQITCIQSTPWLRRRATSTISTSIHIFVFARVAPPLCLSLFLSFRFILFLSHICSPKINTVCLKQKKPE